MQTISRQAVPLPDVVEALRTVLAQDQIVGARRRDGEDPWPRRGENHPCPGDRADAAKLRSAARLHATDLEAARRGNTDCDGIHAITDCP